MAAKMKVAIVVARCCRTRAEFGMRYERFESTWVADWAFLLKPGTAKREGYENTQLNGTFQFGNNYPGCPAGKSPSAFVCECGKLGCWDGEASVVTCPWCDRKLTLGGEVQSLHASRDR